jgi:glycosyltransferase involved in cell wall biosynthesis
MNKLTQKIVFFQRKPRKHFNYSLEFIFEKIRQELPNRFISEKYISPFLSNGIFRRLFNVFHATFYQGDINHLTGDIYYLSIFFNKRKTITTYLDIGFMNTPSFIKKFILRKLWIEIPIKKSKQIITISNETKNEILKYVNCQNKIRVIYVPISSIFKPIPKIINKDCPNILQIGVAQNKNLDRLIDALIDIPCHLEIIGKVDSSLLSKLNSCKISHTISYSLTTDEVYKKYISADVVTLISTYEGFGMPIVEANAVGRVVVTSSISSMPEIAANAAHLVNPYDVSEIRSAILEVIHNDTYREKLIVNGYENIKRFTSSKIVSEYVEVYDEIIKNKQ